MNHPFDLLKSNLLDLLYELRDADMRLLVGGGYGLYLKRQHLQALGSRSLLSFIPEVRSTNDLDMFLTTDVMVDLPRAKAVLEAVKRLEFVAIKDRENFQFIKTFSMGQQSFEVKIDFLTKMPDDPIALRALDIQNKRVRNKKSGGIHGHLTVEAIAVEDNPVPVVLEGLRTTGEEFGGQVYLPQAYSYLIMKLFAFRDWETKKQNTDYSRKHALDIYSIVAMLTEEELTAAGQASRTYQQRTEAREAANIVNEFFSKSTAMGDIRLREHPSFNYNADTTEFTSVLIELFPL